MNFAERMNAIRKLLYIKTPYDYTYYVLLLFGIIAFMIPLFPSAPRWLRRAPARTGLYLYVRPFAQAREIINGQERTRLVCRSPGAAHKFDFDFDLYQKIAGPHRRKIYYIGTLTGSSGGLGLETLDNNLVKGFCRGGPLAVAANCPVDTTEVEVRVHDIDGFELFMRAVKCPKI